MSQHKERHLTEPQAHTGVMNIDERSQQPDSISGAKPKVHILNPNIKTGRYCGNIMDSQQSRPSTSSDVLQEKQQDEKCQTHKTFDEKESIIDEEKKDLKSEQEKAFSKERILELMVEELKNDPRFTYPSKEKLSELSEFSSPFDPKQFQRKNKVELTEDGKMEVDALCRVICRTTITDKQTPSQVVSECLKKSLMNGTIMSKALEIYTLQKQEAKRLKSLYEMQRRKVEEIRENLNGGCPHTRESTEGEGLHYPSVPPTDESDAHSSNH